MPTFLARVTGAIARVRAAVARRPRADLRGADVDVLQVLALQSGDAQRIRRVLDARNTVSPAVVAHSIPLLATEAVAPDVERSLRRVVDEHAGKLLDTLLDAAQPPVVRLRVARVLASGGSPRIVEGLLAGLASGDPDVRGLCARALVVITGRRPHLRPDERVVLTAVLREARAAPADPAVVFTLLALVLPRRTVRRAYQALRSGDTKARGTALEYLRGVLRPDVREALWPLVTASAGRERPDR